MALANIPGYALVLNLLCLSTIPLIWLFFTFWKVENIENKICMYVKVCWSKKWSRYHVGHPEVTRCHISGASDESIAHWWWSMQVRDSPCLCNTVQASPGAWNRGISVPTKRTVSSKNRFEQMAFWKTLNIFFSRGSFLCVILNTIRNESWWQIPYYPRRPQIWGLLRVNKTSLKGFR